jgi:ATP phosphoribosyltransferase
LLKEKNKLLETDARPFTFIWPQQSRLKDEFNVLALNAGLKLQQAQDRSGAAWCEDLVAGLPAINVRVRRPGDALRKITSGQADMAVLGYDKFIEAKARAQIENKEFGAEIVKAFDIAACSLYIAAPEDRQIKTPDDLKGLVIATSYPYALGSYLARHDVDDVQIIYCEGGTEAEIADGSADAIFEIVQTGASLKANNLEPKIKVCDSSAVLVARAGPYSKTQKEIAGALATRLVPA